MNIFFSKYLVTILFTATLFSEIYGKLSSDETNQISRKDHFTDAETHSLQVFDSAPNATSNLNLNHKTDNRITTKNGKRRKKTRKRVISSSTWAPILKGIESEFLKSKRPKTRRIKRRRKIPVRTTTSSPAQFETVPLTSNVKTSIFKKKQKKYGKPKNKNPLLHRLPFKSENLVMPIIPKSDSAQRQNEKDFKMIYNKIQKSTRCSKHNGGCAHISLSTGTEKCKCFKGFKLSADTRSCEDINECNINNGGCQENCTNTIGSYQCLCSRGLRLSSDLNSCEDIDECLLRNGHGPCQDYCENTLGGYKCNCHRLKGTRLSNDLHSCEDVDECTEDNGGCSHICINTFGRSFCTCPDGMELDLNYKTCRDINECKDESIKKSCPNGCINTEGSYKCMDISDIQQDETYAHISCEPLFPPKHGYFKCSRNNTISSYTKYGRKRIKNGIGTKCILVCPERFKRVGQSVRIICGLEGKWIGKMNAKCVPIRQKFNI